MNLDGAPAIGQKMRIPVGGRLPSEPTTIADGTIVGVVKDIMQEPTDGKRPPLVFFPRAQQPVRTFLSGSHHSPTGDIRSAASRDSESP